MQHIKRTHCINDTLGWFTKVRRHTQPQIFPFRKIRSKIQIHNPCFFLFHSPFPSLFWHFLYFSHYFSLSLSYACSSVCPKFHEKIRAKLLFTPNKTDHKGVNKFCPHLFYFISHSLCSGEKIKQNSKSYYIENDGHKVTGTEVRGKIQWPGRQAWRSRNFW